MPSPPSPAPLSAAPESRALADLSSHDAFVEGVPHRTFETLGREGGDYALDFHSDLKTLQILEGSTA